MGQHCWDRLPAPTSSPSAPRSPHGRQMPLTACTSSSASQSLPPVATLGGSPSGCAWKVNKVLVMKAA